MKNKTLILILIVLAVFFGSLIYFALKKEAPKEEVKLEQEIILEQDPEQELYAIAGDVVKVDVENKYLIIYTGIAPEKGKEVKVKLDERTEILKLTVVKPPAVEESPVTMADIKVGDHILAESTQSIFGKTEIADVWKIRILP